MTNARKALAVYMLTVSGAVVIQSVIPVPSLSHLETKTTVSEILDVPPTKSFCDTPPNNMTAIWLT
jgi:hypothetical protein